MVKDVRAKWKRSRIGVLMGGGSAERAISLRTGQAIWRSLKRQGFRAFAIDAREDLSSQLRKRHIELAYIGLHGPGGEDGSVQGLLEWMKIPYTGSGVLSSAQCMNKVVSKRLFDAANLETARWVVLTKEKGFSDPLRAIRPLRFPVVVKPACQGSALGISIVRSARGFPTAVKKAFRYGSEVLVEQFLRGPEITVGVLGKEALPIIEIVPSDRPFYDFHAKYAPGGSRHILPARISSREVEQSKALALAACQVLQTRAVARVDLIVDAHQGPCLLEVNTIPGMTETSLLPEAAQAASLDFDALVLKIMEYSFAA